MDKIETRPEFKKIPYDSHYQQLDSLYKQSLFKQAYDYGFEQYGDVNKWPTLELKLIGARILGQLGLYRKSDALIFRLWRLSPLLKTLSSFYISTVNTWHGPLLALNKLQEIYQKHTLDNREKAHLKIEEASILMTYRDFSAAKECLESIPQSDKDRWVKLHNVELKLKADDYISALTTIEELIKEHPDYRPAIQKHAHILQLLNRPVEAIDILSKVWKKTESWWTGRQLFELLLET